MRRGLLAVLLVVITLGLYGLMVPYSELPMQTETNVISGLQRVSPEDYVQEAYPTKTWLWQDTKNLNFVIESHVDSSFVAGPVSTRDTSVKADYLRIQLITLPDAYFSYLYNFYATGNLFDAVRETGRADIGFNTNYSYESTINGAVWRVTGRIPLGELRFSSKPPYLWKIIVTRHYEKTSEDYSIPPLTPKLKNDYFTQAYDIRLDHPIKRDINLNIRPYLVRSYDLLQKSSSFDPDNLGLDVVVSPAQKTRIKLSLNPDFSDVPPDEAADIYNSKYPRYYIENRFFFTEDMDVFGVGGDFFSSRRIIKPSMAFKATGHSKSMNWGILAAKDKEIIKSGVTMNRDDYYQVLSLMPKTRKFNFANAIVSRMNEDYYNHVYSGNYSWNPSSELRIASYNAFSIKEDDRSRDNEQLKGSMNSLSLTYAPEEWSFELLGSHVSRDMYADAGYLNSRHFHKLAASLAWDSEESLNYVTDHGFGLDWQYWKRYAEENTEDAISADYYINLRTKLGFNASITKGGELDIMNNDHDVYSAEISGNLSRWQQLNLNINYNYTEELVYSLLAVHSAHYYYASVWGTLSQVLGYDVSCSLKNYSYPKGIIGDYGGLLPYGSPLDDKYVILNSEISYTPNKKLSLACGSSFSSYEESGILSNVNLYSNLRYEFARNYFFYCGFNTAQLQDVKFTKDEILGHFMVDTSTAFAKVVLDL